MKKILLSISVVAIAVLSFSSCKKCGHCVDSASTYSTPSQCNTGIVGKAAYNSYKADCNCTTCSWVND